MFSPNQPLDETPAAAPESEKRNSGRTGPTSEAGRAASSQNARKHGACSKTLILPMESEEGWLILLSRWQDTYQPAEGSLEAEFVLRTAQADWFRVRTQRQYDEYLVGTGGLPPFLWDAAQIKMHDLMLRYKGNAERTFHREYRALEAHYKSHKLTPKPFTNSQPVEPFVCRLGSREEIRQRMQAKHTPISPQRPPSDPPPSAPVPQSHEPVPESDSL
jgi:hypothetical protein